MLKVEKISDNKIKITLTIDELSERKITLKDIEKNHSKAQDLFMDLLEESNLQDDFIDENAELFVEATSDNSNFFMITITKVNYLKALPNYNLLKTSKGMQNKIKTKRPSISKKNAAGKLPKDVEIKQDIDPKVLYNIKSFIYKFDNMDDLSSFCKKAIGDSLFVGSNCLYKHNNNYFIVFKNSTIKKQEFMKTFRLLSEYCSSYYSSNLDKALISERAELILDKNAI